MATLNIKRRADPARPMWGDDASAQYKGIRVCDEEAFEQWLEHIFEHRDTMQHLAVTVREEYEPGKYRMHEYVPVRISSRSTDGEGCKTLHFEMHENGRTIRRDSFKHADIVRVFG